MSDSVFQGLPVWNCFPGSPADKAGVKQGDIVVLANGQRVSTMEAYAAARRMRKDKLELVVLRGKDLIEIEVALVPATDAVVKAAERKLTPPTDLT